MDYPILKPAQLPAHLRSLRKAAHMTQAQLAAKLGVNQTRIGKIERNPGQVSVEQLMRVLSHLNARLVISVPQTFERQRPTDSGSW